VADADADVRPAVVLAAASKVSCHDTGFSLTFDRGVDRRW